MTVQEHIQIHNQDLTYTLRVHPRSKRIRLTIAPGGNVNVSVPRGIARYRIHDFLTQHGAWILKHRAKFEAFPVLSLAERKKEYAKNKTAALRFVRERLAYFNTFYHLQFRSISIRNQTTRWGSCSARGVLSFNYKVVLLPPALADYVVVHELCHLAAMNHSAKFWALVARTIPDHKERRKQLRATGLSFS